MPSEPLLTVVTVVLNDLQGLVRTHNSLEPHLEESDLDIEWLVVDGGSVDGSREFAARLPFARLHGSARDRGIYDAMNLGLSASRGRYVWFVNAGDLALPRFRQAVRLAAQRNTEVMCCGVYWIENRSGDRELLSRKWLYRGPRLSTATGSIPAPHPGTVVMRQLAQSVGFDASLSVSADYGFLRGCLRASRGTGIFDSPISGFVLGGVSGRKVGQMAREANRLDRLDGVPLFPTRLRRFALRYAGAKLLPIQVSLFGERGTRLSDEPRH